MAINPDSEIYQPYYDDGWTYTSEVTAGSKRRVKFFDAEGIQRCGARKRSNGEICSMSGRHLFDNGRCRFHGGATPNGADLPQFKTGVYSEALEPKLRDKYQVLLDADSLTDLREDIALVSVRIMSLLETLDNGELTRVWTDLSRLVTQANSDLQSRDVDKFGAKWFEIRQLVQRGNQQYLSWQEASQLVEQKRKLVESESRIALSNDRSIAVADHFAIITALVEIFLKYVKDEDARLAAHAEIKRNLLLA